MKKRITLSLPAEVVDLLHKQSHDFTLPISTLVANAVRISTKVYAQKGFFIPNTKGESDDKDGKSQ